MKRVFAIAVFFMFVGGTTPKSQVVLKPLPPAPESQLESKMEKLAEAADHLVNPARSQKK